MLVYNRFVSALSQHVEDVELLPIPEGDLAELDARERAHEGTVIFEPEAEDMLDELLRPSLEINDLPRAARVDRLRARRAHDRDAQRLRERERPDRRLTLAMNRARQAEITQEILEVVAGADALQ